MTAHDRRGEIELIRLYVDRESVMRCALNLPQDLNGGFGSPDHVRILRGVLLHARAFLDTILEQLGPYVPAERVN